jgi:hypothetical protein
MALKHYPFPILMDMAVFSLTGSAGSFGKKLIVEMFAAAVILPAE